MKKLMDKARLIVKQFCMVIEKCPDTGMLVGSVPGMPGAHTQASTMDELQRNMQEVLQLLLEDQVQPESEFVGTQIVVVN